jgi:hypothetical protein
MTRKTKYELMTELKELCRVNKITKSVSTMLYKELEHEILIQKEILRLSQKVRDPGGPRGPRIVKLIENEDGFKVPVEPEKRLMKPEIKRPVGRPKKVSIEDPPILPAFRHETLGADSDSSDSEDNRIVHVPATSSRCTCINCPLHNSKTRY